MTIRNLQVTGSLRCEDIISDSLVDIISDSILDKLLSRLPFGPIKECHGCERESYGFVWDCEMKVEEGDEDDGGEVERQMCLECLYQVMLVERVRARQFREQNKDLQEDNLQPFSQGVGSAVSVPNSDGERGSVLDTGS